MAAARQAASRQARLQAELADVRRVLGEVDDVAATMQTETQQATAALKVRAAAFPAQLVSVQERGQHASRYSQNWRVDWIDGVLLDGCHSFLR